MSDRDAHGVQVFGPNGQFFRTLGRQGAGPGEFVSVGPPVVRGSLVYVFDARQRRLVLFNLEGEHLWTRGFPGLVDHLVTDLRFVDKDRLVVEAFSRISSIGGPAEYSILAFGRPGASVDTLGVYHSGVVEMIDEDGGRNLTPIRFGSGGGWDVLGDSSIVIADGYASKLSLFSWGEVRPSLARSYSLPLKSREVSDHDVTIATDSIFRLAPQLREQRFTFSPPPRWSSVTKVFSGSDGRVWLRIASPSGAGELWWMYDLDSGDWKSIRFPSEFRLMSARDGRMAGVWRDELEVQYVRVYEFN